MIVYFMVNKAKPAFLQALAIASIIGFISIMSVSFFGFTFLSDNAIAIMLIVLGAGLAIEGEVQKLLKHPRNGLTHAEISHIFAIGLGIAAFVLGILMFVGISTSQMDGAVGLISIPIILVIIWETWVV